MNRWHAAWLGSLLFAAVAFALGINWGLPTRAYDPYLFGDRPPWTGQEILQLAGDRPAGGGLGADVDRDPIPAGGVPAAAPVELNRDDARRAEIVRRYRLYSAQPDEMITFMSLAGMRPAQWELDPKLYQYGGLWIYPVGGLLRAGAALGAVNVRSDPAYYLDQPEQFGRFYVVARAYAAAWGLVGAAAVFWLVRWMTRSAVVTFLTTAIYALLPAVVNMAHEAKPHLPAAALMLWACVAATKYATGSRGAWWIAAAALCGAAVAMILSAWPIVFVVPVMLLLRGDLRWGQRAVIALASGVIALDVYFACNPYVLKHLLTWDAAENPLRSNLANSAAMYRARLSAAGLRDAGRLLGYAATPLVAVVGIIGAAAMLRWTAKPLPGVDEAAVRRVSLIVLTPTMVILLQFALVAAGKPGEHARFALFPAVALLVFAAAGAWRLGRGTWLAGVVLGLIVVRVGLGGAGYVWHFINDATRPTRLIAADRLRQILPPGGTLAISAEPAPYACPPVNLFDHRLLLLPRSGPAGRAVEADVWLFPVDDPSPLLAAPAEGNQVWIRPRLLPTPISWAGKSWLVRTPTGPAAGAAGNESGGPATAPAASGPDGG